jgi:hypothetical protein
MSVHGTKTGSSPEVRFDGRENVPLGRRADAREVAHPIHGSPQMKHLT